MVRIMSNTKSQVLHKGWGIIFVWNNWLTDLLSVKIVTGLHAPQNVCPNSLEASKRAKNSFA